MSRYRPRRSYPRAAYSHSSSRARSYARRSFTRARHTKPSLVDYASLSMGAINVWNAGGIDPSNPKGTMANLMDAYFGTTSGWRYAWDTQWKPFFIIQAGKYVFTHFVPSAKRWKLPFLNVRIF